MSEARTRTRDLSPAVLAARLRAEPETCPICQKQSALEYYSNGKKCCCYSCCCQHRDPLSNSRCIHCPFYEEGDE